MIPVFLTSFFLMGCQTGEAAEQLIQKEWETTSKERVSIHDPSITTIHEENQELFYVFGSHLAQAKTQTYERGKFLFLTNMNQWKTILFMEILKKI